MALKIELRIEYHAEVFMPWFDSNFGSIEKHGQMDDSCIFSLGKDNLYDLFAYVRIKLHLPIRYDVKIYFIYQRQHQRLNQLV